MEPEAFPIGRIALAIAQDSIASQYISSHCTQLRYLATHGHWSPFAIGHCGCLSLNARIYYQLKTEQGRTINATHFVTGMLPTQDDFLYVYVGQVGTKQVMWVGWMGRPTHYMPLLGCYLLSTGVCMCVCVGVRSGRH